MNKRQIKFIQAVKEGKLDRIDYLLLKQSDLIHTVDEEQKNCLHLAIEKSLFPMTFYFLDLGVKVTQKDSNGWTPLHLAASKGYLNIFRTILLNGGNIFDLTNENYNVLQLSVSYGQIEIISEILDKNLLPIDCLTPGTNYNLLQLAVLNAQLNTINYLIDRGMDVNVIHPEHGSLLRMAVKVNLISTVELLLQRGIKLEHLLKRIKSSDHNTVNNIDNKNDNSNNNDMNNYNNHNKEENNNNGIGDLVNDIENNAEMTDIRVEEDILDNPIEKNDEDIIMNDEQATKEDSLDTTNSNNQTNDNKNIIDENCIYKVEEEIFKTENQQIKELLSRHYPQFTGLFEKFEQKTLNKRTSFFNNSRSGRDLLSRSSPTVQLNSSIDNVKISVNIGDYKTKGKANNASKYKSEKLPSPEVLSKALKGDRSSFTFANPSHSSPSLPPFPNRSKENNLKSSVGAIDEHSSGDLKSEIITSPRRKDINYLVEAITKETEGVDISIKSLDNSINREFNEGGLLIHLQEGDLILQDIPIEVIIEDEENDNFIQQEETKTTIKIVTADHVVAYPGAKKQIGEEGFMWSWVCKAAGFVIDDQARESLEHISRLLNTLLSDREAARSVDALLALTYIAYKYQAKSITSSIEVSESEMQIGAHYFKFACAAYGWKMLNPIMFADKQSKVLFQGLKVGDPTNNEALCEHTGISPEDIIAFKWTSSDYHPAHYIAVDHSTLSIIIAIRGSFHIKDALVDLIASSVRFKSGYAHTGMLECAKRKLETIRADVELAFEKFPHFRLVVVGHSLGAGTASLLTLLLKDEYPNKMMHCYAYATPCVLSADLALSCSDLITSYALGHDCVPRLSYGSIYMLKLFTSSIMNQTPSTLKLFLLIKSGKLDLVKLRKSLHVSVDDHLLPPGLIYYIIKDTNIQDNISPPWMLPSDYEKCYRMEKSNATFFYELVISSSMFSDHLPWNYHQAFEGVLHRHHLLQQHKRNDELTSVSEARFLNSTISFESDIKKVEIKEECKENIANGSSNNNNNNNNSNNIERLPEPEIVILEGYYPVNSQSPGEFAKESQLLSPILKKPEPQKRESSFASFFRRKKS